MQITINLNEETKQLTMESSKPIRVDDFMTMLFTAQLSMLREATPNPEDPAYNEIRDLLYDNFNQGASMVLSLYAPDQTLRPDLTAEAMLEAENKYMEGKVKQFTPPQSDEPVPDTSSTDNGAPDHE